MNRSAARSVSAIAHAIAWTIACTLIVSCTINERNDPPPIGNPPTPPPAPVGGGTGAKNEKDVVRFPTETKLANEVGTIGRDGTKAKTTPATGADVATLAKGTIVVQIAKHLNTGVLVVFNDARTGDRTTLMGWVPPESLAVGAALPEPGTQPLTPPLRPVTPVAPAPPRAPVDGGAKPKPPAADAGKPPSPTPPGPPTVPPPTPPPGPPGLPAPPPGALQVIPVGGQCPPGMTVVGPFCRRPCTTDAQCPPGTFCTNASGPKTCAATK